MFRHKLLAAALTVSLLVAGVAVAGAVTAQPAPDQADGADAGPQNQTDADERPDRADGSDRAGDAANERPVEVGDQGPPTSMPEHVPDHVTKIHETINAYLDGDVDDLGEALSDFLSEDDGDEEDETDEEESEDDSDAEDESDDVEDEDDADEDDVEEDDGDETDDSDDADDTDSTDESSDE